MKILYYASILAGELDSPDLAHDEDGEANSSEKPSQRTVTPQVHTWRILEIDKLHH